MGKEAAATFIRRLLAWRSSRGEVRGAIRDGSGKLLAFDGGGTMGVFDAFRTPRFLKICRFASGLLLAIVNTSSDGKRRGVGTHSWTFQLALLSLWSHGES